jgi:IS30 family transposase
VQDKVHILTSDHGKIFGHHQQIAECLRVKNYFTHHCAAWEWGTNENTNGLLRQYFPKKYDPDRVSDKELEHAA